VRSVYAATPRGSAKSIFDGKVWDPEPIGFADGEKENHGQDIGEAKEHVKRISALII
jgi:hypothetical protein